MTTATVGDLGEIALPAELRQRYGLTPNTPLRLVETRAEILIVPLTDEPMSEELAQELRSWQELGQESML